MKKKRKKLVVHISKSYPEAELWDQASKSGIEKDFREFLNHSTRNKSNYLKIS